MLYYVFMLNYTNQVNNVDNRQDIDVTAWQRFKRIHALSEPFVWQEVQLRLQSRLDLFKVVPQHILNVSTRAGTGVIALKQRYPNAKIFAHCANLSAAQHLRMSYQETGLKQLYAWLNRSQPLHGGITWSNESPNNTQYDLIVCNLGLTHAPNPVEQLRLWAQLLAPGGVLLFSAFGPDTGHNIRIAAQQAGWTTPIGSAFVDMHDYGDMMVQAGLTTPVMDIERLNLTYSNAQSLRQDCVGLIANVHPQRLLGLAGKSRFKRLSDILNAQKPLTLPFELIFGHAFKPIHSQKNKVDQSISYVSVDSLKASVPKQKNG
jgi:malonyl-CoA O-methyltransferase